MTETSTSHGQGRAEWPTSRRTRRRRESKVAYRNNPPYSNQSAGPSTYTSPPDQPYSRNNGQVCLQQPQEQAQNLGFLDFFDIRHPSIGNQGLSPIVHQDGPVDASWFSLSSTSYTLASNPPNSPHGFGSNNALSVNTGFSPTPNYAQDIPWNGATPRTNSIGSETDDLSMLDFESFGGTFDSMLMSTPSTAASSMSEGYVFPMTNSGFGPSEASQLDGLTLSVQELIHPVQSSFHAMPAHEADSSNLDEYYQVGPTFDSSSPGWVNPSSPTYQEHFHFENDGSPVTQNWTSRDVYTTEAAELSSITLIVPQQQTPEPQATEVPMLSQTPWNSQTAQISEYQSNASPGINTFEPPPGVPYYTHIARQEFLDTGQPKPRVFGPEPVSPAGESESDGWLVPSYPSSYAASHSSPNSHDSPASRASSPPQHEVEHQHIFTSIPGVRKTKVLRGRQRGLTALEKKQARDVRECRSCWACHISKTKCSPCSPGRPCEQCARLAGKRRFCLFSCFNDPLETLSTFLIPDYLTSHLTKANVESFVSRNASSWGTEYLFVRMSWGYKRRLLDAEVVALTLVNNNSEMGYQELAVANGNARPLLVRKASPPLGIPLAAMDDMQDKYASYIQDIVQSDLAQYVPVAYTDQDSLLPQRLLGAVCAFYTAGSETDNESPILRRAIEIHVTAVILERNLGLDSESLNKVQNYLQEEYPPRSAPRCAQRQVKLAFFMLQQRRIMKVLKEWGNMMWTIKDPASKDKEWAIAFSVFLMLTLVIDKTLGAAYYFCEARIAHSSYEAGPERARFQELVRLTEKELFDRCKEIFHWKLKTRKGGKEACNPIRDGVNAFKGKSSDSSITRLVTDLQAVVSDYEQEVRSHRSSRRDSGMEYTDAGRLACVFLDDFLNH